MSAAPSRQRARSRAENSQFERLNVSQSRPGTYSSPLPQTEWSDTSPLSESRRRRAQEQWPPQDRYVPSSPPYYNAPAALVDRSRSQTSAQRMRSRQRSHELFLFENEGPSAHQDRVDPSQLHPRFESYGDRRSTYSAPDELEHYYPSPVEPGSAPGYMILSSPDDSAPEPIPPYFTYPPANETRRAHSRMPTADNAFADVDDFHLFVQATAGLRPEEAFSDSPRHNLVPEPLFATFRAVHTAHFDSPNWEESGTMRALQQLARMPESYQSSQREIPSYQSSQREIPQLAVPDFDPRPSVVRAATVIPEISPVEESEESDDGLPNYAESQAEAQARQRFEATRRAEELRRRWQQTGSRRGLSSD